MTDYKPVVFNAGSPIDVNLLNRLQDNITSIKTSTDANIQNATLTVNNVQKNVKVVPVVYAGSVAVKITNNRGYQQVDFSGSNFVNTPVVVASVETNTKPADQVTLRATATSKSGGEIEVFTADKSKLTEIKISFIAVEMRQA